MSTRKKRKRQKKQPESTQYWCEECSKIIWQSKEQAIRHVESVKSRPGVKRPDLLDSYLCPKSHGWHVGHNYKLRWISLCIGEHK